VKVQPLGHLGTKIRNMKFGFRQKERNLSLKKIIAAVSAVDKIV
jgi:hypothetical protein